MLQFIKENINWIKDLVTLIFAATATIIGVLTYRRARATILQPIRSEVIKKQSELLSRLLQILKDNNQSFENGIDYVKVVQVNVFFTLRSYGFILKGQEQIFEKLDKEIVGWIPCGDNKILRDVEIISVFKSEARDTDAVDLRKEKYENLKIGKIDIDKIYQTRTLKDFINQLSEIANNPFMPLEIQKSLIELMNTVESNLSIVLKSELEKFMIEFSKAYFKNGVAPNFDPIGVYNNFNHERIHHRSSMMKLRKEVRKYLLIDEPW